MTRSVKNTFAPISRVPPEVFSLIPDYCKREELIALTHVCRSWREIFISRASLWTFLNCTSFDKTNTYIQRSKGSPLEISLVPPQYPHHLKARNLILPLTHRFKTLKLFGLSRHFLEPTQHFCSPAPLLEKLDIQLYGDPHAVIENTIFGGNLSSLRELRLCGILTDLPWQNMTNLTTFDFRRVPGDEISATQLLDFLENSPPRNQTHGFAPIILQRPCQTNGIPPSPKVAQNLCCTCTFDPPEPPPYPDRRINHTRI